MYIMIYLNTLSPKWTPAFYAGPPFRHSGDENTRHEENKSISAQKEITSYGEGNQPHSGMDWE